MVRKSKLTDLHCVDCGQRLMRMKYYLRCSRSECRRGYFPDGTAMTVANVLQEGILPREVEKAMHGWMHQSVHIIYGRPVPASMLVSLTLEVFKGNRGGLYLIFSEVARGERLENVPKGRRGPQI